MSKVFSNASRQTRQKKIKLSILDEKILSLLENPGQFWESINAKQKQGLQEVLFPDGLHYSPKTKEYRT
jgi:hypothetical protein